MPENEVEIGKNLLLAIELVLKSVEIENKNHFWRRLRPGKQIKTAFGIDMSKPCKEPIKPRIVNYAE